MGVSMLIDSMCPLGFIERRYMLTAMELESSWRMM